MVDQSDPAVSYESWLQKIEEGRPDNEKALIRKAFEVASIAHEGQTRASGEPYITHCLAAAQILADLHLDSRTLAATLLHDTLEDTDITLPELEAEFGQEIAQLVDGVTKLQQIDQLSGMAGSDGSDLGRPRDAVPVKEDQRKKDAQAENLRKMFMAMVDDIRVVLIKLADRLHNMRTLHSLPEGSRQRIAQETLDIFAPLANRLGIWQIKSELEDLSFRYLEPEKFREITGMMTGRRQGQERYLQIVIREIRDTLAEAGIKAEVSGRSKHVYSVYRKMRRKGVEFGQIYDVRAVRIIVDNESDCYAALGVIHGNWRLIPDEFDDYISSPKENLYRSLHTAVIGPGGKAVEVQIRTAEMHHTAELGIAAHWRYKEGHKPDPEFDDKIAWLRQVMGWQEDLSSAHEFVDALKTDVFQDHVYTFTPKGDILELPQGATPIDFAYQIHTEVGNRCRGAKVNGKLVGLDYRLRNGDIVEILTSKRGGPSLDWLNPQLNYAKTTRAISKIRQWFKRQNREQNISQGREVLERELKRLGVTDMSFDQLAKRFKLESVDDLMAAIGAGDINSQQIAGRVLDLTKPVQTAFEIPITRVPATRTMPTGVRVEGVGNLLTRLAQCCNPLPGDPIVGYVTRGRGVTIHRRTCPNMLRAVESERMIEVEWGETQAVETYPVTVRVEAFDRSGLVRDVTTVVAEEHINISDIHVSTDPKSHIAAIMLTLHISEVTQLFRVLTLIARVPNVVEAVRQTN